MAGFILGIWVVTSVGGAFMWAYTNGVGRPESVARSSNLSPLLLCLHPLVAFTGLVVWIAYLYVGGDALPWVAFAALVVAALIGDVLLVRTLRPRPDALRGAVPHDQDPGHTAAETEAANRRRAEDLIPKSAIVAHGVLAVLLLGLVLLVALGFDGGDDAAYEIFSPTLVGR